MESEANDGLLVLARKVESSVRLLVDNEVGLSCGRHSDTGCGVGKIRV